MPVLQAGHKQYFADVQFIGIDTKDDAVPAADFLRKLRVTYPQLVDTEGSLLARERIPGLPVTLLVDSSGSIIDRHIGVLNESSLRTFVEPVLSGS